MQSSQQQLGFEGTFARLHNHDAREANDGHGSDDAAAFKLLSEIFKKTDKVGSSMVSRKAELLQVKQVAANVTAQLEHL